MASFFRETGSADILEKNQDFSDSINCGALEQELATGNLESNENQNEGSDEEIEDSNDDGMPSKLNDEYKWNFNLPIAVINEDVLIARLYKHVVNDILNNNFMHESQMHEAIDDMKEKIRQGHATNFADFHGIDFCNPTNRCGYLTRYAICHTGLVREAMGRFFGSTDTICNPSKEIVLNTNRLKVVSLGGGPGNDLVGLCSALDKTGNCIEKLDITVVDISQGWESVFPSILSKANAADFGSFSKFLKRVEITTNFVQADLNAEGIFEDQTLSTTLNKADLVLMVKLLSFMPHHESQNLIQNVVKTMQVGARLIIIDIPFDKNTNQRIPCLLSVYLSYLKYGLPTDFSNEYDLSIKSSQAYIGIYFKSGNNSYEDSSSEHDELQTDIKDSSTHNEHFLDVDKDTLSGIVADYSPANKGFLAEHGEHSSSEHNEYPTGTKFSYDINVCSSSDSEHEENSSSSIEVISSPNTDEDSVSDTGEESS